MSYEAECEVIGTLARNPASWDVIGHIDPDDFNDPNNKIIMDIMQGMRERDELIDTVTVLGALETRMNGQGPNLKLYFSQIVGGTSGDANAGIYGEMVRKDSLKRRLQAEMNAIVQHSAHEPAQDILERLRAAHEQYRVEYEQISPPKPLFGPESFATTTEMLNTAPKPIPYIIADHFRRRCVHVLAGAGASSKTYNSIQLAMAIGSGTPWMGYPVLDQGKVVFFMGEDNTELHDTIHHRVQDILDEYQRRDRQHAEKVRTQAQGKLAFLNLPPGQLLVNKDEHNRTSLSALVEQVADTIEGIGDVALVVFDPASRFRDDENDNASATRLIEAAEHIARRCNVAVVLTAHVSKMSQGNQAGRESADALRGAKGLVDGSRWAANQWVMAHDEASDYGIEDEDRHRYVRFYPCKYNDARPKALWLERGEKGVLWPIALQRVEPDEKGKPGRKPKVEDKDLPDLILNYLRAKPTSSWTAIRTDLGGNKARLEGAFQTLIDSNKITPTDESGVRKWSISPPQGF